MNLTTNQYPNETIKLLLERGSCRNFSDQKIDPDVLEYILKAGIHAPTGGNLQPFSIIKIEEQETSEKLAELCGRQMFIAKAPVNLLFCIDLHRLKRWAQLEVAPFTGNYSFREFWISFQDTIIAAQNICTAADAMGLGSVYIGTVLECFPDIKEMFELPLQVFPVVLLSLGYPKSKPNIARKLDVDVIVHDEKYHDLGDEALLDAFNKKYNSRTFEINEGRMELIHGVTRQAHGDEFAEKCVDKIRENGHITMAHRYFGMHYLANLMPRGNDKYLEMMEDFGFFWFKKWIPAVESIGVVMEEVIEEKGIEEALQYYHKLKNDSPEEYDFSVNELNILGYELMKAERYPEAVEIFKLNLEQYPDNANDYDSLGEAYMLNGNIELAIKNYEKALELNPDMPTAIAAMKKLKPES